MPRKTSFCNAALLRSDIKRYWPLLFLYVAVWVVILPMQILSASRECDGVAEGIMTVLQLRQHNVIIQSIPASVVMSLLFGCFAAMAVWSYLMSGRTVGLMHALPVTRTQAFFSHVLSALGALTAGNVLIFLLTALCSAGFSYVDWAALGTWLLLTELMALFFFALGSLCAMVTGWLLAVPVLYGAMNVVALLLYAVISTMTQMFYFGYSSSDIPEFITWLTPVGRIWDAVANGGAQPIEVQFREPIGTQSYQRVQLPASAFSTCIIYAAVGIDSLARYGGVNAVISGYVRRYDTDEVAELTRQQAQDLVSHALADAANSRAPIDPLRDDMYSSTNLDIEIRLNTDKGNVSFSLNVPDFAVETQTFLDALEFEEPVDGTYDSSTVAVDEILYN